MLYLKLKALAHILNGPPFEISRIISHPRSVGPAGINGPLVHVGGASRVEEALLHDVQRCLGLSKLDLKDIHADFQKLLDARHNHLKCPKCSKYMRNPLYIRDCNHSFCGDCLAKWLEQSVKAGNMYHPCPYEACEEFILVAPSEIPVMSALAEAIFVTTCLGRTEESTRWSAIGEPSFDAFFK